MVAVGLPVIRFIRYHTSPGAVDILRGGASRTGRVARACRRAGVRRAGSRSGVVGGRGALEVVLVFRGAVVRPRAGPVPQLYRGAGIRRITSRSGIIR